ncbi:DUF1127 domain-containing protein [Aureimonas glaciei]|uniref:YjiS-like domain-containing protein n=1 Tax=Aureimonas glaciei TaxID=1776957 RepID=A0A916XT30_9HYPH|nr:DUF1127 domain-containing protein [Aureimonas glaciei]GGD06374.1 hypothetical protein GCM10011335_06650 [Aureimonas glaciei]
MTTFPRTPLAGGWRTRIPSPRIVFAGAAAMLRGLRNRRAAYRLAELPDYLLNDIGLRRDDVHEALNRGWQEDPTFQLAIKASRRRRGL